VAALLVLVLVGVAAAAITAWWGRPREVPAPSRARLVGAPLTAAEGDQGQAPAGGVAAVDSAAPATPGGDLVVHVVGAVRHPGVVELPAGSRLADAVAAVGGLTRRGDPASINLARPAVDGEQVVVLRRGAAGPGQAVGAGAPPAPTGGATTSTSAPVDLNTASLEQLDGLPGIGPVLAQRILDWRSANGRFSTVEELAEVSGIGEATLGDLRPLVTV
jgi:competence protein ComEA